MIDVCGRRPDGFLWRVTKLCRTVYELSSLLLDKVGPISRFPSLSYTSQSCIYTRLVKKI